jgi:hypothetical protein
VRARRNIHAPLHGLSIFRSSFVEEQIKRQFHLPHCCHLNGLYGIKWSIKMEIEDGDPEALSA